MWLRITFATVDGEGITAGVVGGVGVHVVLVPPGLISREVELKLGEGVDVHEGGDGAIEGRLHHDVGFNIRGGGNAIRFHGVMVSRDLLDFSGSHFLMNIFFI